MNNNGVESTSKQPNLKTFGDRLWDAARAAGGPTTQQALSAWFKRKHGIAISGPQLSKYKKHDILATMENCRAFAVALNVSVEWLVTGRGSRHLIDGPMSETESRVIAMWRQLTPRLKQIAFSRILDLRLKPDIATYNISSEEELDRLVIDTVSETGEFRVLHDERGKYEVDNNGGNSDDD